MSPRSRPARWRELLATCLFLGQLVVCRSGEGELPRRPSAFVRLLNAPQAPADGYLLRVLYRCTGRQAVHLAVVASSETRSEVAVFRRWWACGPSPAGTVKAVRLDFPDQMLYRPDDVLRHAIELHGVELRVWVTEASPGPAEGSYETGLARAAHLLQPLSPSSRPFKVHPRTLRWDQEILWSLGRGRAFQCQAQPDAEPLLTFAFASSGESFGIVKTFEPRRDRSLEKMRQRRIPSPRCTIAVWLFLVSYCPGHFCGVLYHLSAKDDYATPSVLLTHAGTLHVQVVMASGQDAALQSPFLVPLYQWCRVELTLRGRLANLTLVCGESGKTKDTLAYTFPDHLYLDDTEGRFVLGGSEYIHGISGFYGPAIYYRSSTQPLSQVSEVSLPEPVGSLGLTRWFAQCRRFKEDVSAWLRLYQLQQESELAQESCLGVYKEQATRHQEISPGPQCLPWDAPFPHRRAAVYRLLWGAARRQGHQQLNSERWGRALYRSFERRMTAMGGLSRLRHLLPLLLQAGCLRYPRALYLASILHQTGLGMKRRPGEALKFSLLAAQQDGRLAGMLLGHKHHLGVDGFPVDHDLSYAYYANVAAQTLADREQPGEEQAFVESVRLIDEDALKVQTKESDDLFLWLRFQARRGVVEAQQAVSQMLFWGQRGIASNLQAAAKFYEKGATQLQDPALMYDYGVVLLRGQGVKQDIPKALEFLKKAAEQRFARAVTALGWYYQVFEHDYRRAAEFWERADGMGDAEAASNLGALYAQGRYPARPKDHLTAYHYFWTSATRGHVAGAVRLAVYLNRGIPGQLPRRPLSAVLWAKWVSEQNGYLGSVLRKALDAYLQQSWPAALLHYLMAAEAGFEVAQFNAGYLCDQDPDGLASRHLQLDCVWKYYNLSTCSQRPVSYALIRMGDLFYAAPHRERTQDVQAAVRMYKAAALQQDPQGLYSLGLLLEEGVSIPCSALRELGFNGSACASNYTVLLELYQRCRDHVEEHSFLPCSLALVSVHLKYLWLLHSSLLKFSGAIAIVMVTALSLLAALSRLHRGAADLRDSV
ncbi:protein sel-1 homolog 3-like [Emydura macquarii macquarii]|uniref:protein sel-1 homolog 3-like n=1 Tax=Emydura macquarii macquarii TaxID=1129001 RepID=UPI00352AAF41